MKVIYVCFFVFLSSCAYALEGVVTGVGINEENKDQLWTTSIPYAIARQGQRSFDKNEVVEAFLDLDDSVLSLSSKPSLIKTLKEGRVLQHAWPLIRWQDEYIESDYLKLLSEYPGTEIVGYDYEPSYAPNSLGCLAVHPLRYGDIEKNNSKEVILFLGNDMVVFSPEKKEGCILCVIEC